jgi:hypothetical protein
MLGFIKDKIAEKFVEKQLREKHFEAHSFTDLLAKAFTYFIVMPGDDRDFTYSLEVLNFLSAGNKSAMVLTRDFKVSLLPQRFRSRAVPYSEKDITKLNLPSKRLIQKLNEMQFNVAVDLNRRENLFCSFSLNMVQAPVRVGFAKADSDRFYNLQVINKEDNPEISYKNFLNCLKMFQEKSHEL